MPPRVVKHIEHLFKDVLHFPFSLFLRKGNASKSPVDPETIKSILILRPDKLGDMIATIPVIHAIKQKLPHIRVEVMASPSNKSMVENDPLIDEMHIYSKNILRDWPVIMRLRKKRFDIVYDPICHDSVTGLLLTKLIGKWSINAAARKLRFRTYYDYCEPYQSDGHDHNIDNGLLVFNLFGIKSETVDPFLPVFIPESSRVKADKFFQGLPNGSHFWVGINISAGSPTRTLSPEKYVAIANSISQKFPEFKFIIICTMSDRDKAALFSRLKAESYLIPENLSFLDVSAILSRLNVLISPDTSMVHIARLMKIPVVGLYSGHRRNFYFWRPYRQEHGAVVAESVHNLLDIEPERVVDEFCRLLEMIDGSVADRLKARHS